MKFPLKYLLLSTLVAASFNLYFSLTLEQFPVLFMVFTSILYLYVPGVLALSALKSGEKSFWTNLVHSMGLSITAIYVLGLAGSYILPNLGYYRPFDLATFALLHYGLVVTLFFISIARNWKGSTDYDQVSAVVKKLFGYFLAIIVATTGIGGALYLNNGGSYVPSIAALFVLGMGYFLVSVIQSKVTDFLKPYFVLALSLALLWMLSARSEFLIGWDIIQEYLVSTQIQSSGKWSMINLNDAYNACLSITILPTIISNVTKLPIEFVFKYIYPFIFGHFALIAFLVLKKLTDKKAAFLSTLFLISQPFFNQAMIGIARQEIGFFFFALLLLTMLSEGMNRYTKTFLILLYIFSLTVSHYSTSYVTVAIFSFSFAVVLGLQLLRFLPLPQSIKKLAAYKNWLEGISSSIKWWIVAFLVACIYAWYFLITQSAGNVQSALGDAFKNMSLLLKGEQKSQEVKQALPGLSNVIFTTQGDLAVYEQANSFELFNLKPERREEVREKYKMLPLFDYVVSPSIPNNYARILNYGLNYFKNGLKVVLVLGTLIICLKSLRQKEQNTDLIILSAVCTAILLVMILHPTIGLRYNISRIYLQLLVVIGYSVVVGLDTLFFFLSKPLRRGIVSLILIINLFYLQSGFTPLLGGAPVLQFYNQGADYEKSYMFKGELLAAKWLHHNRDHKDTVYADNFAGLRLRKDTPLFPNTSIVPTVLANNLRGYVYLTSTNKQLNKAQVLFNNKFLTYTYPIDYLNDDRNLIYSNKKSSVYK